MSELDNVARMRDMPFTNRREPKPKSEPVDYHVTSPGGLEGQVKRIRQEEDGSLTVLVQLVEGSGTKERYRVRWVKPNE
jgi:hypothetical protein